MVIYIKDDKGKIRTLSDIANEYNLPIELLRGRLNHGKRTIEELTKPKHYYQHRNCEEEEE